MCIMSVCRCIATCMERVECPWRFDSPNVVIKRRRFNQSFKVDVVRIAKSQPVVFYRLPCVTLMRCNFEGCGCDPLAMHITCTCSQSTSLRGIGTACSICCCSCMIYIQHHNHGKDACDWRAIALYYLVKVVYVANAYACTLAKSFVLLLRRASSLEICSPSIHGTLGNFQVKTMPEQEMFDGGTYRSECAPCVCIILNYASYKANVNRICLVFASPCILRSINFEHNTRKFID